MNESKLLVRGVARACWLSAWIFESGRARLWGSISTTARLFCCLRVDRPVVSFAIQVCRVHCIEASKVRLWPWNESIYNRFCDIGTKPSKVRLSLWPLFSLLSYPSWQNCNVDGASFGPCTFGPCTFGPTSPPCLLNRPTNPPNAPNARSVMRLTIASTRPV